MAKVTHSPDISEQILQEGKKHGIGKQFDVCPIMAKYYKKPIETDSVRWFFVVKPQCALIEELAENGYIFLSDRLANKIYFPTYEDKIQWFDNTTIMISITKAGIQFLEQESINKSNLTLNSALLRNIKIQWILGVATVVIAFFGAYMAWLNYRITVSSMVELQERVKRLEIQLPKPVLQPSKDKNQKPFVRDSSQKHQPSGANN